MTVALTDLIEEWEAINLDLYKASLESHHRYPFPSHLFQPNESVTSNTAAAAASGLTSSNALSPSSSAVPPPSFAAGSSTSTASDSSSTAAYARVYQLVARVRYIAEDARYNSFNILQHLIWVTVVAWANQLAVASGGRIQLPAHVRQRSASASSPSPAPQDGSGSAANDFPTVTKATAAAASPASSPATFPCSLLAPLTFWDPNVLAEAAGAESPTRRSATATTAAEKQHQQHHRALNLPVVWANAVERIVTLWSTPISSPATKHRNNSTTATTATTSGSHLNDAYAWVLAAQHYHRFKAILSLFFLRYDAHLEELEEQQRRLGQRHVLTSHQQQQQQHSSQLPTAQAHAAEAGEALGGVATPFPSFSSQPSRRRGPHLRVPSDVSTSSAFTPPTARTAGTASTSRSPQPHDAERTSNSPAAASAGRASAPLPTTARLLALMMCGIETENLHGITAATGEAVLFLLMPPVHRARLREKVMKARQQQQQQKQEHMQDSGKNAGASSSGAPPRSTHEDPLTEPEYMASAFLDGCAMEEEDEDDDKVVWSAPPSPLLSFHKFATLPPGVSLTPIDQYLDPTSTTLNSNKNHKSANNTAADSVCEQSEKTTEAVAHGASTLPSPVLERAQKEEYVIRNVFKLLLMTEDCRVYALQHWLVEAGKHVVAVYGAQLASLFFEETGVGNSADAAGTAAATASGQANKDSKTAASPALTVRTLADANRVLRETIQSYVRLRTKLLFLNAGTTHFLEALTPWGRTRMLENLNAFLCGFCGVTLPHSTPGQTEAVASAATLSSAVDAAQYFTPTNAAVAAFARTWAVPLWLAMCDDTQHRLESLQAAKQRREDKRKGASLTERPRPGPLKSVRRSEAASDPRTPHARSDGQGVRRASLSPSGRRSPSHSGKYTKEPAETEGRSPTDGQETSIASADLGDAVSQAPSGSAWPPSSPTAVRGSAALGASVLHTVGGAGGLGTHDFARARSRGVDLRRVLQQHQRQRVPFEPLPQRSATAVDAAGGRAAAFADGSDAGGLEESLYSAETASIGETPAFLAGAAVGAGNPHDTSRPLGVDGNPGSGTTMGEAGAGYRDVDGTGLVVPANSVEAAVAAARQRRRQAAAAAAAQEQRTILGAPGTTQRFSRAAQLHQVATLPDEGFPSLMYLMPRRSRFIAQDKAAAAVQQELFTRFSSDVHHYLATYLAECEAGGAKQSPPESGAAPGTSAGSKAFAAHDTPDAASGSKTGATKAKTKKKKESAAAAAGEGEVRPLPQPVLTHMIFLLDMTYAALQGSGIFDSHHGHTKGPLMETGLTATGRELGAAILEQDNGEYESVVSTTLSAPTSPAVLTIAAVRKGFQGFLAAHEKRAVLTLAQALYGLVQQGMTRQPPSVALESVDTLLNMASLLNSKDMFVSLMKGFIAPQVMMCRSINDAAVESQVVARMAYRLGSAVAAPCLTLLRDLRLAMLDPINPTQGGNALDAAAANGEGGPLSWSHEGAADEDGNGGMTADGARLVATRNAQTLAAAAPLRHGAFGLIHRIRVLCQAWWQPHTAVLLSSRRLQRLWERYQLLDERVVDAVLRVEWRYNGHTEPFYGYGRLAGDVVEETSDISYSNNGNGGSGGSSYRSEGRLRSSVSDSGFSGGTRSSFQQQRSGPPGGGTRGAASATAVNVRRGGTAAAVIQGFSSALGNAVRRTGHHAGAFGNNESDNESEDYSEAYGGLLTLNTLQRHRGSYTASNSSYRGSNVSSIGGGGGRNSNTDYWDASDGGQSTIADEAASSAVPPTGERERRQLRWPLGDGQLVFLLYPKHDAVGRHPQHLPHTGDTAASRAVQVAGPPLTLLVCQLLDRAALTSPYTFDKLHKALPVQTPKPLLAHLLHELVKAGVVTRSIPAGTRQYAYELRGDVQHLPQRKVVLDVRAAAQQYWVTRTLTAAESDTEQASQRDPMSPASPTGPNTSFSGSAGQGARGPSSTLRRGEVTGSSGAGGQQQQQQQPHSSDTLSPPSPPAVAAATPTDQASPAYSAERIHKIKVCIVRIMKSERVLPHRELLERVAAALEDQFVVTSGQFKRCVAHLIEKEFLQRSEGGEEYMYLT